MKDPRTDSKIDLESKFKIKSEKKKKRKIFLDPTGSVSLTLIPKKKIIISYS